MQHILYPWLIYFVTESVYLVISLTYFSPPQHSSPSQPPVFSLYLWLCFWLVMFVHVLCFLDSTYKWNHTGFVFVLFHLV